MRIVYIFLLAFFATTQTSAQFGNTAEVITRSTNTSLFRPTIADIDHDGDNDVLATHQNCIVFYENIDGKGNFSPDRIWMEVDYAVATSIYYSAVFQDLDADGLPDVAADRYWRKNLGSGNFAARATAFTSSLDALCDVNGDNLPDAINHDASKIYWQRNLGNGSFSPRVTIKNAASANIFEAKDLNADGKMDFVANQNGGCYWYKNLGTNQFDTLRLLSFQPNNIRFLDIDADGKYDVFSSAGTSIYWHELEPEGTMTLIQTVTSTQFDGGALVVGDMNADGFADIFAGNTGGSANRAQYFPFNPATGKFSGTPISHNTYLIRHGWADFVNIDGDAEPDILASTTYGFGWLKKISPTQFSAVFNITQALGFPKSIQSSDFENDGDTDLFINGYVFRNLGNGQYAEKQKTAESGSHTYRADLDSDGLKDLARPFGDSISWRKNLGGGQFSQAILLPGLVTSCKGIGGGDLDQDGDIDLFACNGTDALAANARFYWFENDGKGKFKDHLLETGIQLCSGAFSLDVDEDGNLDMVLTFFNGHDIRWYRNLGGGNFDSYRPLLGSLPSPANINQSMVADLDADGRLDYLYSTQTTTLTKVAWFRNLGNSTFGADETLVQMGHQGVYATPYFAVFDATLDGLPDLIVSDNYWNRFHLLPSAGGGKFGASKVVYDEAGYGSFFGVVGHDVDGDGRLDLVFGNRTQGTFSLDYHQLSWLRNLHPKPIVPFAVNEKYSTCSDNQTPDNANDDFLTISLKIKGFDNSSTQFVVTDIGSNTVVDTFEYDKNVSFALPPGSAGDGNIKTFKVYDLLFQDTFQVLTFESGIPCSSAAPTEILASNFRIGCRDNNTPGNPKDDRLVIWLTPRLINPPITSPQFNINSNFGWPIDTLKFNPSGKYYQENYFELPDGSAAIEGKLILTIQDSKNPTIIKQIISEVPGTCSGAPLPCPFSVNYHSQIQIDSFSSKFPGCRVLEGDLTVDEVLPGADAPSIESLLGFKQLLEVRGDVNISHTHLKNLKGLDSLHLIGRSLSVLFFNSPELTSLSGLNNLRSIGQDLWLSDTLPTLKNFAGLDNLDSIGRDLTLWQMKGVKNFKGLEKLKTGGIWTYQCDALESLEGLENLTQATAIAMQDNANLKTLKGLENLKTISGGIFSVLLLIENRLLDDVSSLNHDMFIEAVEIRDNPRLSTCAVKAICQYLKNHEPLLTTITDNLTGCNSIEEVQELCIVSTGDPSQGFDFQVFPNPISTEDDLMIQVGEGFSKQVKVEILSL
ncbi:MAG TPA: VCBS repeat-containing protein, partial [Saprospiraceae bacterium]|nr:VCBS repeat-containing protein [Saprospiraceae bacterium]